MSSSSFLLCLLLAVLCLVAVDALPFFGFGKESNYEAQPSSVFYGRQVQDAPQPERGYVYSRMRG